MLPRHRAMFVAQQGCITEAISGSNVGGTGGDWHTGRASVYLLLLFSLQCISVFAIYLDVQYIQYLQYILIAGRKKVSFKVASWA